MPELYRLNNNIRTSGVYRRADPFQFRFLYTIEDLEKRTLLYIPAFDWNSVDGFMAGVVLNNGTLVPKPVEYLFIPFYAFRNQGLTGYGKISFNITPYNSLIRIVTFTIEGEKFGAPGNQKYQKAKIGVDLGFRSRNMINPVNQKSIWIFFGCIRSSYILNFSCRQRCFHICSLDTFWKGRG